MEPPEEAKSFDGLGVGFPRQVVLRPALFDQPRFYPFYKLKPTGLAEVGPLLAELDNFLVPHESFCDENRHAAWREDLVALLEDGAGG